MILRWLLAALHLMGLGIGLGAVWARGRVLRGRLDPQALRRLFAADAWWGIAAIIWLVTGLWRLLAGVEKPTGYYLHNHVFLTKMALFVLVVILELRPAATLMRWRRSVRAGELPDTSSAPALARVSTIQAFLVVLMLFAAAAMARGLGGGS